MLTGVAGSKAVLVNNTNFSAAAWSSYNGAASFQLGPTDGVYQVWLGLKGFASSSAPVWVETEVYLDRVAPVLAITSPLTNSTVSAPWLQLQGYSPEVLQSITYDLSNAMTLVTNQPGYGTSSYLDTNTLTFTTNWFQCYDIFLTNGLNRITVHGTDMAGNVTTTNVNVNLNYASASNPVIQVTWPQNGMKLCQNSFDLRGWTEDAAATVFATITDTNGNTNTISGTVERTGVLWVEGLPLADGTNYLTLVVTNTAGLVSTTNLFLLKSDMALALTSITGDLWNPTVSVSGNVSDTTATIYVNGVQGVNNGDGTWSADQVPVSPSGVASFDLKAVPAGGGDPDLSTNIQKDAEITFDGAKWTDERLDQLHPDSGDYYSSEKETWDWTSAGGGTLKELWQWNYTGNHGDASFPIATGGDLTSGHLDSWWWGDSETYDILAGDLDEWITPVDSQWWITTTHGAVGQGGYNDWKNLGQEQGDLTASDSTPLETWSEKRTEQPVWTLHTGGKKMPGGQSLFSLASQALEELAVKGKIVDGVNVPNTQPTINGKAQGTDGILWTTLPDGADVKLTFQAGVPLARIGPWAQKYRLLIQANGNPLPHQIASGVLSYCVGENLTFAPLWFPSLTFDDAVAHWSLPDKFVNENPYPYCDAYYDEDPSLLNRILSFNHTLSTSVWYVRGLQAGTAKLSMNMSFPNGQTVFVSASGQFNMHRPTYSPISLVPPPASIGISGNVMGLKAGVGVPVTYFLTLSSKFQGTARYCQVFTGYTTHTADDFSTGGGNWLDNSNPYPFADATHTNPGGIAVPSLRDAPWDTCVTSPATSQFTYIDYFQFVPDAGPGPNIPVTLGNITWAVHATATQAGGVWTLGASSSVTQPSGPVDSDAFPLWVDVYTR